MDLNLLASLDVLIEESNVTHAAARLGISQPALSAQLVRLRELIGDPLLTPSETGRGMVPTARAMALRDPLRAALRSLESAVRQPPDFDPLQNVRDFVVSGSDLAAVVLGLPLIEQIRRVAGPGIRLSFRNLPTVESGATALERGDVDLVIAAEQQLSVSLKARKLLDDRYVVVQRKGHPRGESALDIAGYCALEHLLVSPIDGDLRSFIDAQLEALGYQRTVTLSVPQFILAPLIVERTDIVATLPERFARRFADRVSIFELPFATLSLSLLVAWHVRSQTDPAHSWLRNQLAELARHITDENL